MSSGGKLCTPHAQEIKGMNHEIGRSGSSGCRADPIHIAMWQHTLRFRACSLVTVLWAGGTPAMLLLSLDPDVVVVFDLTPTSRDQHAGNYLLGLALIYVGRVHLQ